MQRELALDSLEEGGEDETVAHAAGFRSIARHDLRIAIVVVQDLFEDRFDDLVLVLVHEHARIRPRSAGVQFRSVCLRFARSVTPHRRSPAVAAERKTAPGGNSQGLLSCRNPAYRDPPVRDPLSTSRTPTTILPGFDRPVDSGACALVRSRTCRRLGRAVGGGRGPWQPADGGLGGPIQYSVAPSRSGSGRSAQSRQRAPPPLRAHIAVPRVDIAELRAHVVARTSRIRAT